MKHGELAPAAALPMGYATTLSCVLAVLGIVGFGSSAMADIEFMLELRPTI